MENGIKKTGETPGKNADKASRKPTIKKLFKSKSAITIILSLLVVAAGGFVAYSYQKNNIKKNETAIKENTEKFIRENLVQPGSDLKISDFQKEGDLYKMTVLMGSQSFVTYVTKDGKKLFPQAIDLDKKNETAQAADQPKEVVAEAKQKKDVPAVELFVMSYCPYGLQAEKGILPVVKKLGSKIDFKIRFVDYIMHGKKEADENANQYCIQKEEPVKLSAYLECFTKEGDSAKCATNVKIDKAKLNACVSATDKEFKITENANGGNQNPAFNVNKKENDAYGVQGSPTLVVNGTIVDSQRDPDSFLKAICSGFTNKPAECNAGISSAAPAAGFGEGKSAGGSGGNAACGQQ